MMAVLIFATEAQEASGVLPGQVQGHLSSSGVEMVHPTSLDLGDLVESEKEPTRK